VAPLWQDHYRPIDQFVSEMGGKTANHPWLVNGGLLAWGVSMLACAAALWMVMPRERWRPWIAAALGVAGAGIVVAALVPVDCSTAVNRACFDRWMAGEASWHHTVHAWAAVVTSVALAVSSLAVAGFLSRRRPVLALVPGIGGALALAWTVLGLVTEPHFDAHAGYGVYQRVSLLLAAGWIVLLGGAVLIRLEERRRPSSASPSAAPPTWSAARPTQPSA
jgi:hypothetical membrane protein